MQKAGIDHPGDEGPGLRGVPAPVPAPGLIRPDCSRHDAERPDREGEHHRPVGKPVDDLRRGQQPEDPDRSGLPPGCDPPGVPAGEEVHDSKNGAHHEGPGRQGHRGHVDREPVGVQRRDQRAGRRVNDGLGQPEREQHRGHHEQAQVVGAVADHEGEEEDDRHAGDRGDELVHVPPRDPVHGEPAGQHPGQVHGETEGVQRKSHPHPAPGRHPGQPAPLP